jgi:Spx/MgsR family transcriptional regulator
MIEVYGIKNCDSVKKALKFFKEHNLKYTLHDFKEKALSCDTLSSWLKQVDMKTLFNTRSTTYRNLKLKELKLSEEEQKEWLCKENLLIKRPVLSYKDKILVGFNEENYKGVFL